MLRQIHRLLWEIRLGRCGPTARRLALLLRRVLPIRGIGPLTSIVIGAPPAGTPCGAIARIAGASFELDLREALHRTVYLDLFSIELRRVVLPLLRSADVVVDVGANFGFWTVLAARRGCRVLAVEPVASTRRRLVANVERNGVTESVAVVAEALSDSPGEIAITVPDGESGQASAYPDPRAAQETYTVPTTTLDQLIGERRVRFLKVDVEGHELAVLRGAARILSSDQVDYVLVELSSALIARAASSRRELIDLLVGHGYVFVTFVLANQGLIPRRSYPRLSLAELRLDARAGDALWRRATLRLRSSRSVPDASRAGDS